MRADPDRLRAALESFLVDDAEARLGHYRGDPSASDEAAVVARHRWLSSREAASMLAELADKGYLSEREAALLGAHLERYARASLFASLRRTGRDLSTRLVEVRGRGVPFRVAVAELCEPLRDEERRARVEAVEGVARRAAPVIRERRAEAEGRARSLPPGSALPRERAEAFLAATAELRDEGLDFLARFARRELRDPWDLLPALRAPSLDDVLPREGRYARFGELARALGVERELSGSLRVDAPHGGASPAVRLVVLRAPRRLRIAPSSAEYGVVSELSTAHAVGRAAAASLTHVALPIEARYPLEASVGRAFGALFAQWLFDPARPHRRTPAAVLDATRRVSALAELFHLRLAAASLCLSPDARPEEAAHALHLALGLPPSEPAVASILLHPSPAAAATLRGGLGGLALWHSLREHFDADWYENPRARDVIRGAAARGEALPIEALLDELGGDLATAVPRLLERFRG